MIGAAVSVVVTALVVALVAALTGGIDLIGILILLVLVGVGLFVVASVGKLAGGGVQPARCRHCGSPMSQHQPVCMQCGTPAGAAAPSGSGAPAQSGPAPVASASGWGAPVPQPAGEAREPVEQEAAASRSPTAPAAEPGPPPWTVGSWSATPAPQEPAASKGSDDKPAHWSSWGS